MKPIFSKAQCQSSRMPTGILAHNRMWNSEKGVCCPLLVLPEKYNIIRNSESTEVGRRRVQRGEGPGLAENRSATSGFTGFSGNRGHIEGVEPNLGQARY
jgi:hypothetical protein